MERIKFDDLIDDYKITISENIATSLYKVEFNTINFEEKTNIKNNLLDYEVYLNAKDTKQFDINKLRGIVDISNKSLLPEGTRPYNIYFKNCHFKKDLNFEEYLDYNIYFDNCTLKNIHFINLEEYEEDREKNEEKKSVEFNKCTIENITIINCNFSGKFYINDQKNTEEKIEINNLTIKESTFNENFKLHNCEIKETTLDGVDFKKNADFFKSTFINGYSYRKEDKKKDIIFNGINVDGLTIFEECEFKNKFILKYVTFNGLAQFRKAIFVKGFDLDRTNSEKEMNFYGVIGLDEENSIKTTSQETYRGIKYNCERIGNIIDANKYYALELEKKQEDLNGYINHKINKALGYDDNQEYKGSLQELIVFKLNWYSSKFGTSWARTLFWIVIVGLITSYNMPDHNKEYGILENIFTYMSIANIKIFENHPIAFFLNKVSLGYLYYQFITAVRKDTRK